LFSNGWRRNISVKPKIDLIVEIAILSAFLVATNLFLTGRSVQERLVVAAGMVLFVFGIGKDHRISTKCCPYNNLRTTLVDSGISINEIRLI